MPVFLDHVLYLPSAIFEAIQALRSSQCLANIKVGELALTSFTSLLSSVVSTAGLAHVPTRDPWSLSLPLVSGLEGALLLPGLLMRCPGETLLAEEFLRDPGECGFISKLCRLKDQYQLHDF